MGFKGTVHSTSVSRLGSRIAGYADTSGIKQGKQDTMIGPEVLGVTAYCQVGYVGINRLGSMRGSVEWTA